MVVPSSGLITAIFGSAAASPVYTKSLIVSWLMLPVRTSSLSPLKVAVKPVSRVKLLIELARAEKSLPNIS